MSIRSECADHHAEMVAIEPFNGSERSLLPHDVIRTEKVMRMKATKMA
jgi:hypothetical protein